MNTVMLTMIDTLTGEQVMRTIDATNEYNVKPNGFELKEENDQRNRLEEWVSTRGNEQHETVLELVSWEFNV